MGFSYTKERLRRYDSDQLAFDENIYSLRSTYQFTRFLFARGRVDYDTLAYSVKGQFLFGWTPNPGTAFYVGYTDGYENLVPDNAGGFRPFGPPTTSTGRQFFVKTSYLFRF